MAVQTSLFCSMVSSGATVDLEEGLAALTACLSDMWLAGEAPRIRGSGGIRTVEDTWVCWRRRGGVQVVRA
jgi:hypothetical protein